MGLVLLATGAATAAAYGFAGYLVYRRYEPLRVARRAGTATVSTGDLVTAADGQLGSRNVEQALVAYRQALARDPRSARAQLGVARAELAAGREDVAAREYERVLLLDRRSKPALAEVARIYSHNAASWHDSESRYREYLKLAPEDADALLGLARVSAWQGKAADAAALFARRDVAPLMNGKDQRDYAFSLVKLKRDKDAEPLLKALLDASPGDEQLRLQLAGIYAGRRAWDSALPLYRALLAKKPNDPQLNLTYGLGLLSSRRYEAAVPPLERARNAMPSSEDAGIAYARALKGAGDRKKSLKEYDRVLPRFARNPALVREYADVLLENRDYKKSATYYGSAYGMGLRDDRILLGLAGAYCGAGKYKDAVPYLEELHRRAPTPRVTFELARAMAKTGRNDRAKQLLREVEPSARR